MKEDIIRMCKECFRFLTNTMLVGVSIGIFVECGVILIMLGLGCQFDILTVVVTFIFAVIIGIALSLEIVDEER